MTAPADRPLSLARVKALPVGAVVKDAAGVAWGRALSPSTGRPGWFYRLADLRSASPTTLWQDHRPLQLVAGEVTP
jgi:hypothetical protein